MKKRPQTSVTALQVPHELLDFVIQPTIVVKRRSGAAILKQMKSGKATKALRDLMRSGD
ncbi:MAG: hypothetical protein QOC81_3805 [Thermoanaerobaculia bacterium]|jgi:hypothetical protein|nr:hypothetical protein [Thermoanaerobaculia bacterium]